MNIALFILRMVVGVLFMGHGSQNCSAGSAAVASMERGGFYKSVGYRPGRQMAIIGGVSELGGGLLLTLGLLTPLGCAAIIGMMVAAQPRRPRRQGRVEQRRRLRAAAGLRHGGLVIAYLGPGAASLDEAKDLSNGGAGYVIGALLVAVGMALMMEAYRRTQMREMGEERAAEPPAAEMEERPAA